MLCLERWLGRPTEGDTPSACLDHGPFFGNRALSAIPAARATERFCQVLEIKKTDWLRQRSFSLQIGRK
jgi:hypothetical protein